MTQSFVVGPEPADGPWRVLAGGDRTGGNVVFGEALLPPHTGGPSLHVHTREDEAAYVIEGVLTVRIGERTFEVGPGSLAWLPRNEPHTFANLGDVVVRVLGVTTPAGLEGMFAEQAEYFSTLTGPPDEQRIAEIGARYGVRVVGPGLL
jgi:mannose-6-phosphate isomerase-like protein (cupin superfamily)